MGGALRDILLGLECRDYDLITPGDPTALAKEFAEKLGGTWFLLDSARRHSRVVCKNPQGTLFFDFAPFRFSDLKKDLGDRDFTINALAWPLHPSAAPHEIYDPLSGRKDLKNKILRACSEQSIQNDPLRLLRGVRLSLQFGLTVDENTLLWMKKGAGELNRVAAERIKDEVGRIFSLVTAPQAIPLMADLGVIEKIWGRSSGKGSIQKGLTYLIKAQSLLDALDDTKNPTVLKDYLNAPVEEGFSRGTLIKLGMFIRGYDPQDGQGQLEKFRLSRKSLRFLLEIHRIPGSRFHEWPSLECGERGRALWVETLGHHPLELLLVLTILEAEDTSFGLPFIFGAGDLFLKQSGGKRLPDLIAPERLIKDGFVGKNLSDVLHAIRLEEISGRVKKPEEALAFVEGLRKRD